MYFKSISVMKFEWFEGSVLVVKSNGKGGTLHDQIIIGQHRFDLLYF